MKNLIVTVMVIGLFSIFTGCGAENDVIDSSGSSSSSHDSVTVDLLDDSSFRIKWDKNFSGYSEVISRKEGDTSSYEHVMTDNDTGNYAITCSIRAIYTSEVTFNCISVGSDNKNNPSFSDMLVDKIYYIQAREGLDHDTRPVAGSIHFNSSTQALELL